MKNLDFRRVFAHDDDHFEWTGTAQPRITIVELLSKPSSLNHKRDVLDSLQFPIQQTIFELPLSTDVIYSRSLPRKADLPRTDQSFS
jgi:hypothetical protein